MRRRLGSYRITPVGFVVLAALVGSLVLLIVGPRSTEGFAFTVVVLTVSFIVLASANYRGSRSRYEALSERQIDFAAHTRDPREEPARTPEPIGDDGEGHRRGGSP